MVETVMMAKLSTRLGLSDEQALKLVRSRSKFREDTQKLRKHRAEAAKALEAALKANPPDNAEVGAKLNALLTLDGKIASLQRQGFEAMGKNLSVVQRAKLYLFINEFENDMRQLINRARQRGMGLVDGGRNLPPPPAVAPGPRAGLHEPIKNNIRKNLREGAPLAAHPGGEVAPAPASKKPAAPPKRKAPAALQ